MEQMMINTGGTQCEKVLRHMTDHGAISTYEAFVEYGITRLASRICDLKGQGVEITASFVTKKNRYGESVSFKKYSLAQ
jgi:hypothetical protein